MKYLQKIFICIVIFASTILSQDSWIRINQLGYQKESIKTAVFVSKTDVKLNSFQVINSDNNEVVINGTNVKAFNEYASFKSTFRLNFSELKEDGNYYIQAEGIKSPAFKISDNVYDGSADFLLNYMRQQRCGYNPFFKDSCHTHDGFLVDNPGHDSVYVDVKGGWHDASDYLQYLTTSANATYQMLFAFSKNPEVFKDHFDKDGNKGGNGIPDILDEAKWGLDWLVKMNPEYGVMYNQIADDRDHAGYRLPTKDSVSYGKGFERPVYFITGKRQGLAKYKNRTTGVSSSAAKFASAFALGSDLLKKYYPDFAESILNKAEDAYKFAKSDIGVTQTASNISPYFYEEDNYADDMELAAVQLYVTKNDDGYLSEAIYWGQVEPFTPWMGADTARHYQWYPFVNLGHYHLSKVEDEKSSSLFKSHLIKGLQKIYDRGKDNAFINGVPYIWCSNNLVAAALTQVRLYEELTGNKKFAEMEASLRDWLFGCNPWGTSMIVGLPENGDFPTHPHSSLTVLHNYEISGGLVDGPVYGKIFKSLIGLKLYEEDEYAKFQSDLVVYHDDFGDYSTNEPTMDGTASLSFYLSALEALGKKKKKID
ncbi:MAG: glycoside hydrolase family 9 protein [Melioribacteraceae bacterium]|nr:glycoside hydrolase family 9 protein [Melioribacteraceae bacterium]